MVSWLCVLFIRSDSVLMMQNAGYVPEHMNLLTLAEAHDHVGTSALCNIRFSHSSYLQLRRTSWNKDLLTDPMMLPLGLDASDLS